jgi:hypothetical protein
MLVTIPFMWRVVSVHRLYTPTCQAGRVTPHWGRTQAFLRVCHLAPLERQDVVLHRVRRERGELPVLVRLDVLRRAVVY